jgi:hypothetical protein
MTDRERDGNAARRLAILRHAREVTSSVSRTCRCYGITRQAGAIEALSWKGPRAYATRQPVSPLIPSGSPSRQSSFSDRKLTASVAMVRSTIEWMGRRPGDLARSVCRQAANSRAWVAWMARAGPHSILPSKLTGNPAFRNEISLFEVGSFSRMTMVAWIPLVRVPSGSTSSTSSSVWAMASSTKPSRLNSMAADEPLTRTAFSDRTDLASRGNEL